MSISSTFFAHLLRQYFCAKKLQSKNVTRKKLHKAFLYKKRACEMLMKLTIEIVLPNFGFTLFSYSHCEDRSLVCVMNKKNICFFQWPSLMTEKGIFIS